MVAAVVAPAAAALASEVDPVAHMAVAAAVAATTPAHVQALKIIIVVVLAQEVLSVSSGPVLRAPSHRQIRGTYKCLISPAYGRSPSSFKVAVRDCGLRFQPHRRLVRLRLAGPCAPRLRSLRHLVLVPHLH